MKQLTLGALLTLALVPSFWACATDSADDAPDHEAADGGGDASVSDDSPGSVYALQSLVWGDDGVIGYVVLTDTLDLDDLTLGDAREFPGYATIAVADQHLFVTSGETPTIERFAISDELEWQERGSISLHNLGVRDTGFYNQYLKRDELGYAPIEVDQRALWNAVDFELAGTKRDTLLDLERDGLDLFVNYNRNYFAFTGPVMRPFVYHDQDWFKWADDTLVVVYDAETQEEQAVIDVPCPGLDTISEAENGDLYFSNWEYSALNALAGNGAAPCVARIHPDGTLDEDWHPDLSEWTDGRLVSNVRYLSDGKAVGAVLHAEKFGDDFDFEAEYSSQEAFWKGYGLNYRLWMFDFDAETAAPVRGLPDEDIPPSFVHAQLDGRTFLLVESNDFTHTTVYELSLDGRATRRFEAPGSSYQWVKVR